MTDSGTRSSRTRTAVVVALGLLVICFAVVMLLGDGIADLEGCNPPSREDDGACIPPDGTGGR
ncbi:hypothetical protein ACFQ7A_06985 [Streptomyces sp. NPDC056528]|uniref:hypothetical protein n=1 Tax=Streptomyces sp. NPDC056528 TaxID=3345854 RepID=UPI0036CBE0D5